MVFGDSKCSCEAEDQLVGQQSLALTWSTNYCEHLPRKFSEIIWIAHFCQRTECDFEISPVDFFLFLSVHVKTNKSKSKCEKKIIITNLPVSTLWG